MSTGLLRSGAYANPEHWRSGVHLGIVVAVNDPEARGRVQVKLPAIDPAGDAAVWARVAVPFAGSNYGAFFIPDVETEVLVAFTAGDAGWPVVIGNLWNGATELPEEIGQSVDRWTITGKNGTRIAIVEESAGQEMVEITTPAGVSATLTDSSGGEITLEAAGNTVKLSTTSVSVQASTKVEVSAPEVSVSAAMVKVDSGMSRFSGAVQCDTLISNSVVSSSYTPGAGNVW